MYNVLNPKGGGTGGAGTVLKALGLLVPGLVVPGVEVEIDLPLGVEYLLAGTDGADLRVGESHLGHHVRQPPQAVQLVQLGLVLTFPLPG